MAQSSNLKVLNLADYGRWNRITSVALSPDGNWMSYAYQPNDGDATLYIKQLSGDKLYTVPVGSAPVFSDDSRWVGYFVSPPERAGGAAGGGRGGRGGGAPPGAAPPGGRGAPQGAPAGTGAQARRFELLSLVTGEKTPVANVSTLKFSKGSKWLAMRMNKAVATATQNGADLNVRDLATGTMRNAGNVNAFEFDNAGRLLAYTIDAADRLGNGVHLLDPATGEIRVLSTATADYDQLTWSEDGTDLAVIRGDKVRGMRQKANALLFWRDLGTAKSAEAEWNPANDTAFPAGHVLSEYTAPRWSKDRARIFVGIKEQEPEIAAADSLKANVDIWHWKDVETQATQMLRLQQERRATFSGALVVASKAFVRLADTSMRTVTATADAKWGIGRDDAPYRADPMNTQNRADFYRVNVADGSHLLIEKGLTRTFGTSPDSRWFLYLKGKEIRAYDLAAGKTTVIGGNASAGLIDEEDDHASDRSLYGVAGWAKGGASVLLYDKFDVWQVPLDGSKATNLTNGMGKAQQIVFRVARLSGGGGGRGGRAVVVAVLPPVKTRASISRSPCWSRRTATAPRSPATSRQPPDAIPNRSSGPTSRSAARRKPSTPTASCSPSRHSASSPTTGRRRQSSTRRARSLTPIRSSASTPGDRRCSSTTPTRRGRNSRGRSRCRPITKRASGTR